jgi:hypothetical protein
VKPEKIDTAMNWNSLKSVFKIQSFLGMDGYYRRFIEGFSKILEPMTKLLRKGVKFEWSEACENSFPELKQKLTTTPLLITKRENL